MGTHKGNVYLFNPKDLSQVKKLKCSDSVISVTWSPDGQTLTAGLWNGQVHIWDKKDFSSRKIFDLLISSRGDVNGLAYSPDGKFLAAACQNRMVHVLNPSSGETIKKFTGFGGWVRGVSWSPDGECIAAAGRDFTLRIWDFKTGNPILKRRIPRYPVWSLAWSGDGFRILAGNGEYADDANESRVFMIYVGDLGKN